LTTARYNKSLPMRIKPEERLSGWLVSS
jgi:hypothetical protein